jgi:hypothetical protein
MNIGFWSGHLISFRISPTANASSLSTPGVSALQPGAECGLEFAVGAIMKFTFSYFAFPFRSSRDASVGKCQFTFQSGRQCFAAGRGVQNDICRRRYHEPQNTLYTGVFTCVEEPTLWSDSVPYVFNLCSMSSSEMPFVSGMTNHTKSS